GRNLTEERQRKLTAVKWDSLPFQWAITTVRGGGRRKIAILSDPNCPYCKRLEEDLAKLDDITVHILPYAVVKPDSVRQAKAVWCSKDRAKAWSDLMFRRIEPQAAPDCDTPIEKLAEFGRRMGANSTPTWFLENGKWSKAPGPQHDYMGFSATSKHLYSSGHPAPGSGLVNPFGLIRSRDGGKTWDKLGLEGETDFHVLATSWHTNAIYVWNPAP